MSACDKFSVGDYVNVSADFIRSFRFASLLRHRYPAGKVVGFGPKRYEIVLQLDGRAAESSWHMDDWEKP